MRLRLYGAIFREGRRRARYAGPRGSGSSARRGFYRAGRLTSTKPRRGGWVLPSPPAVDWLRTIASLRRRPDTQLLLKPPRITLHLARATKTCSSRRQQKNSSIPGETCARGRQHRTRTHAQPTAFSRHPNPPQNKIENSSSLLERIAPAAAADYCRTCRSSRDESDSHTKTPHAKCPDKLYLRRTPLSRARCRRDPRCVVVVASILNTANKQKTDEPRSGDRRVLDRG